MKTWAELTLNLFNCIKESLGFFVGRGFASYLLTPMQTFDDETDLVAGAGESSALTVHLNVEHPFQTYFSRCNAAGNATAAHEAKWRSTNTRRDQKCSRASRPGFHTSSL